ncbi:lipoyl synthase [Thalassoglobus polymorphus]|uniref:Lipoyl synthase n=1 Tax=Thalassoglobus polymorphus TaxID=2527994 RepID=A0A517QL76_9PLAN|nr:lipoyl synthase [Thalassoglobus polymorphus]QDT32287.1 Lipoyl synthase [Thalassoglobus polymorphus]
MFDLPIIDSKQTAENQPGSGCGSSPTPEAASSKPRRRLPKWLKRPMPSAEMGFTSSVIEDLNLETVCESAKCPNRTECWAQKTATFMILGNVCTRPCGFCSVPKGKTETVEEDEPDRVAEAAARLGLKHVVITCVTRDDLPDGGAEHFYQCVLKVRERTGAAVEVLTSDFLGNREAISRVVQAKPDVFNHNTETVPRLYDRVRRNAVYQRTLDLLAQVKEEDPNMPTKSGLMLGLGETIEEVIDTCADLRSVGVDMITIGQYLNPGPELLPVERYVPPEEFEEIAQQCHKLGFSMVACGPFVRSSYHAGEMVNDMSTGTVISSVK